MEQLGIFEFWGLVTGASMAITQFLKSWWPKIDPRIWVWTVSILGGVLYAKSANQVGMEGISTSITFGLVAVVSATKIYHELESKDK
jgi:hypothetical protein